MSKLYLYCPVCSSLMLEEDLGSREVVEEKVNKFGHPTTGSKQWAAEQEAKDKTFNQQLKKTGCKKCRRYRLSVISTRETPTDE